MSNLSRRFGRAPRRGPLPLQSNDGAGIMLLSAPLLFPFPHQRSLRRWYYILRPKAFCRQRTREQFMNVLWSFYEQTQLKMNTIA